MIYKYIFSIFLKKDIMNSPLVIEMLKKSAEATKAKALLSLDLLTNKAVGIGDHSTEDFFKNAEEALQMLVDSDDKLETIKKYYNI